MVSDPGHPADESVALGVPGSGDMVAERQGKERRR
jgi:hypothetical protein